MLATTLSLPEALQCAWHFGCTLPTPHSALLPLHKQKQHHFIRTHIINGASSSEDNTLLKVFQLIDANKDGLLSLDEVDLYLHKLGLQLSPHAMLALFIGEELADGDGEAVSCLLVDFEGFSRLCESVLGRRRSQEEGEEEEEEDLREVFRLYDRNCDGVISAEEVEMVLVGLGLGNNVKSREGWERMIRKADTNGDGVLDFTEFKMMMTRSERKSKTLRAYSRSALFSALIAVVTAEGAGFGFVWAHSTTSIKEVWAAFGAGLGRDGLSKQENCILLFPSTCRWPQGRPPTCGAIVCF